MMKIGNSYDKRKGERLWQVQISESIWERAVYWFM